MIETVQEESGANTASFLSDHLGSTSVLTSGSEDTISTALYMPWGDERYSSGSINTDYRYTGQRLESDLGIYYYNARWYDDVEI